MPALEAQEFDVHVEAAGFLRDVPAFALANGRVVAGETHAVHRGGLLAARFAADGSSLVTGGEDGRVCRVTADGTAELARRDGAWIDVLAAGPGGAVAFAAGREGTLLDGRGGETAIGCERAIEGIAFAPKGVRVACARYGGASLFFAGNARATELAWDGAHLQVTWSPDGAFVVTSMQEPALHGWRVGGKGEPHLRMRGYPAKVRSMAWSAPRSRRSGRWLATSGAERAVCWPFGKGGAKKGPAGGEPREVGAKRGVLVVQIAAHPEAEVLALGYADGAVALAPIEGEGEPIVLREPCGHEVTALGFDAQGRRLAFGTAGGEAGTATLV